MSEKGAEWGKKESDRMERREARERDGREKRNKGDGESRRGVEERQRGEGKGEGEPSRMCVGVSNPESSAREC